MAKFVLAPCVEDELWEIWEYIAGDNPEAAARVIQAAHESFKSLADRPGLGRLRKFNDARLKNIRSWRISGFENYVIFYRAVSEGIQVLHVYHGTRDLDALFGEK